MAGTVRQAYNSNTGEAAKAGQPGAKQVPGQSRATKTSCLNKQIKYITYMFVIKYIAKLRTYDRKRTHWEDTKWNSSVKYSRQKWSKGYSQLRGRASLDSRLQSTWQHNTTRTKMRTGVCLIITKCTEEHFRPNAVLDICDSAHKKSWHMPLFPARSKVQGHVRQQQRWQCMPLILALGR